MSKKAVVYTGKLCSWCDRVKQLLKDEGYEIEERPVAGGKWIKEFKEEFDKDIRTVPQVVIGGHLVGGFEETEFYIKGPHSINKV